MVQTTTEKTSLAAKYAADCLFGALSTTTPSSTAGTEVAGGSPAYARKSLSWTGTNPITATPTFDVPAATTVVGFECYSLVTAGTYLDGATVTSQTFASQGTYAVTATYTQT